MSVEYAKATIEHTNSPNFGDPSFWQVFRHEKVVINGHHLHYVSGGAGKPIRLIPGWPQSWYAWRFVMPALVASGRRVIAIDPRGLGDSGKPDHGYDLTTVAEEIHGIIEKLGLNAQGPVDMAAHDIGAWIAYAHAADWSPDVRRLALLDAALPGITPPPPMGILSQAAIVKTWHFAFNRLEGLPEILVQGHERAFLTWLFREKSRNKNVFNEEALDEYVRIFSAPGAARAGFDYYRAAFSLKGLASNQQSAQKKLTMPILAVAAEGGVGNVLEETLRTVATDVKGILIKEFGHYLPEECPDTVATELIRFFNVT